MKTIDIAVVGAMGYGGLFIEEILNNGHKYNARLSAIVNRSSRAKIKYSKLEASGVKFYSSLDEMYETHTVDLVFIASPMQMHSMHACEAMEMGSHVMLEKPIAGCMDDVKEIIQLRQLTGRKILVGYQLCYDDTIRKIKEIILSGSLGGMHTMKCVWFSPHNSDYYNRNDWAGKICDSKGRLIFDSIANNAAAHYLMNLLFLAGPDMLSSAKCDEVDAKLFRVNSIETFDTCGIKAKLEGGIEFLGLFSHATLKAKDAQYKILFDDGYIECTHNEWKVYKDGKEYIIGSTIHHNTKKIWDMVEYIRDDNYLIKCTIECALEHTKLIENISNIDICVFKNNIKQRDNYTYIQGLEDELIKAYDNYHLPEDFLSEYI